MDATVMAFRATHSSADPSAYARNKRDSSETKEFPAFPDGTGKLFLLQCTISLYVVEMVVKTVALSSVPQTNVGLAIGVNVGRSGIWFESKGSSLLSSLLG